MPEGPAANPLEQVLEKLPDGLRVTPPLCASIDRQLRDGEDLTSLQREVVGAIVQLSLDHSVLLPPPYDSFYAEVAIERRDAAQHSPAFRANLDRLVASLQQHPDLIPRVKHTATLLLEARKRYRELLAKHAERAVSPTRGCKMQPEPVAPPASDFVRRARQALKGEGENAVPNLAEALRIIDEGLGCYAENPEVLALAAGLYRLLSGRERSDAERYAHLSHAQTLCQRAIAALTVPPYKGASSYDKRREQVRGLLTLIQQDLQTLKEKSG